MITEEHLREVFSDIKSAQGKHRAYINFEDFKSACLKYKPACMQQMILESESSGNQEKLNAEIEEHFRNICESQSPEVENVSNSPKFGNAHEEEDLLGDLGNNSVDEKVQTRPTQKKLKKRPVPHYLTATAASKAMQTKKGAKTTSAKAKNQKQ